MTRGSVPPIHPLRPPLACVNSFASRFHPSHAAKFSPSSPRLVCHTRISILIAATTIVRGRFLGSCGYMIYVVLYHIAPAIYVSHLSLVADRGSREASTVAVQASSTHGTITVTPFIAHATVFSHISRITSEPAAFLFSTVEINRHVPHMCWYSMKGTRPRVPSGIRLSSCLIATVMEEAVASFFPLCGRQ